MKRIYTSTPHPNYVPVLVAFAAEVAVAALKLVGKAVVLELPPIPPVPVPATVACTICPNELKMILTNALSGA
jgi:hypothetical protein